MKKALKSLLIIICIFNCFTAFAMKLNPEASKLYKEAENYFKSKDLKSAESSLNAALKLEPDNAVYRYILGQVQYMQQNYLEAKNNLEIVSRSRISQEKDESYNKKLKSFKKKIKDLQAKMSEAGEKRFEVYEKNKNNPNKLKLAITLYQAFKLNPRLRYKNIKLLDEITKTYESALQKSFDGDEWQKEPMMQLAFLYEISNKKDKATEVYMRALDYVEDPNEEFVITHKFDYLNRSNKEKLLDTIEAGEFTVKDFEDMLGDGATKEFDDEDRRKAQKILDEASARLQDTGSDEDREKVLEDIKNDVMEKLKKELGGKYDEEKLKKKFENSALDDDLKKQGRKLYKENKDKIKKELE